MIDWNQFEHIHVIKKLKEILSSWWNVEILFTDIQGNIRGVDFSNLEMNNKSVQHFLSKEGFQKSFSSLVEKNIDSFKNSQKQFSMETWSDSSLDLITVPIVVDQEIMGSVCGLGFLTQNSSKNIKDIEKKLLDLDLPSDQVEEALSHINIVSNSDQNHFSELVNLVAKEIITLHLEIVSKETRIRDLNNAISKKSKYDNMIGKSSPMQNLYTLLDKIKGSDSTVLIQGENGTGKELIAKAIHYNSTRKDRPLVIQNCSAFNDNLLESELFGHIKGSFTGAIKDKKGLFDVADKGTFFLDEIGDTSPMMQVKLLRVIQEGTFTPVGAIEQRKVDVRIVAATNRNLKKMVEEKTFREDLYYRLNVINIKVPPLRERKEDIPLLTEFFLSQSSKDSKEKSLTQQFLAKLSTYHWPGNIRELQNEIERAVVLSGDQVRLNVDLLSSKISDEAEKPHSKGSRVHGKLKDALEELERAMIQEGLFRTGWNKSKLAKELGISRAGLIMKVEKYNLDKRRISK